MHRSILLILIVFGFLAFGGGTLAAGKDKPQQPPKPDPKTAEDKKPDRTREVLQYWDREGEVLRSRTPIKGNIPHGVVEEYWPDGKTIKGRTPFVNGQVHGVAKTYDRKGNLQTEVTTVKSKITHVKSYYDNGKLQFAVPYKNGKRDGVEKYYSKAGKLLRATTYKAGVKDGLQKDFFENGALKTETMYRAGKAHGTQKTYTVTHQMIWEKPWAEGTLEGEVKSYWPETGKIQSLAVYKAGKKVGKTRFYDKNGKFVKEE